VLDPGISRGCLDGRRPVAGKQLDAVTRFLKSVNDLRRIRPQVILEAKRNGITLGRLEPKRGQIAGLAADPAPGCGPEPFLAVLRFALVAATGSRPRARASLTTARA